MASAAVGALALKLFSPRRAAKPLPSPERIIVIGYGAIGDTIFFLPVLEGLRRAFPRARVTWAANPAPALGELIPATGLVDEIWPIDLDEASHAAANARIAAGRFDWAVLSQSSPVDYFQSGLATVPVRAGHTTELSGGLARRLKRALVTGELSRRVLLNRSARISSGSEHAVSRNLGLLSALGVPAPEGRPRLPLSDAQRAFAARAVAECDPSRRRLAVHLGVVPGQYHKFWDPEKFGRLLDLAVRRFGVELIAVGAAGEAPSLDAARRACPSLRSCVGQADLLETFSVIAACDGFIGNDTGLAKAAMALGVPTAQIWGPTDPRELGAFWEPEKHVDVCTGIECHPCVRLGMPKGSYNYLTCGHHDCLGRLEADFAFSRLTPWLGARTKS